MDDLEKDLYRFREAYRAGAEIFATDSDGVEGEYWFASSGIAHPDYNMALVQGGDVAGNARTCLDRLTSARRPAVLMLAGRGLAAAPVLADAGWVTVAAMPFMRASWLPEELDRLMSARDVVVREGTAEDLPRAREIMREAFGVDEGTAGLVYSEEVLARPGVTMLVSGDGDEIGCVSLTHQGTDAATNWALAAARSSRRKGYAAAMMPRIGYEISRHEPGASLVGLATPMAERAHRAIGAQVLEYWQVWSRPRWMLGAG